MNLTRHFTLEEMTRSQTASRLDLDNTPPPEILPNLVRLCQTLEEVRAVVHQPIIVSSGYRSPQVNAAVGGSSGSFHTLGLAADITALSFGSARDLAERIIIAEVEFDKIILEFERWVHLQIAETDMTARRTILTARHGIDGVEYVAGLVT